MRKVVIKIGTSSAVSTLHTRRRHANDNVVDVAMAAGSEISGAFTPMAFDGATVLHTSRSPRVPTVMRSISLEGKPLVSNTNDPVGGDGAWIARALDLVARLWGALWREWTITHAVSKPERMSDGRLSDIGVQRGDIDFVVRYGRSAESSAEVGS
jgi:uncharacterized protein YjiS (DUF1127 family)